jgi:hypothetical protein
VKNLFVFIFILVTQVANASTKSECENIANNSDDPIASIVACLSSSQLFEPSSYLEITCNGKFSINTNGNSCVDSNGEEFNHCTTQDQSFCFDGKLVMDEGFSSNLNMMVALCTDYKLPKPGPEKWDFGACVKDFKSFDEEGIRAEDELSCFCQDHGDGFRWTCYDISKD